jgi:hypothetical protein
VLLASFCAWFGYTRAARVVSLLPAAAEHMKCHGMREDKFIYIPNIMSSDPVDEAAFLHPVIRRIEALRAEGKFVILHAGNIAKTTPLGSAIDALARMSAQEQDRVRLVLLGRGDELEALQFKIKALGLNCVEVFPQVERSVALAAMRRAHAGYSSAQKLQIYEYGFSPNKVYDYMSQSLPVIFAYRLSENHILATGGAIGCDVEDPSSIQNAIRCLLAMTPGERAELGGKGKRYVDANHNAAALAEVYANTMGVTMVQAPS